MESSVNLGGADLGLAAGGGSAYVMAAIMSITICTVLLVLVAYSACRKPRAYKYQSIADDANHWDHANVPRVKKDEEDEEEEEEEEDDEEGGDDVTGYMYTPGHGGHLDEEYDNTFVGVSIPLLQDVSHL